MSKIIQGVILIDMWESPNAQVNDWYRDIIPKIYQVSDNPYFINACYNSRWDYSDDDKKRDYSQYNTLRQYHELDHQGESPTPILSPRKCVIPNIVNEFRGMNTTSVHFKKIFNRENCICLIDINDFVFHSQVILENKIKNWLVVGHAWNICLHFRKMGLNNLAKKTPQDYNFFISTWSCLTEHGEPISKKHIKKDYLKWEKATRSLYKLNRN